MNLSRTIVWRIVLGLLLVLHLSAYIPWQPRLDYPELDSSWMMGLHWAWLHGLAFGHDVVFTFGPWGFVFYGYNPATFIWTVLGWTLCGVGVFAAMVRIAESMTPSRWMQAIWIVVMICLTGSTFDLQDVRTLEVCLAMLTLHFFVDDRTLNWIKILLTVAMGLITLGKFSMGMAAAGVMLAVSLDDILHRRMPKLLGIYVLSVMVLWLAAGQSPLNFIPWLHYSLVLASGFGEAVSMQAPGEGGGVLLFILSGLGVLGLAGIVAYFRAIDQSPFVRRIRTALISATILGLFMLLFKAGYVRHDHHELVSTISVLLLALMLAAANWKIIVARRLVIPVGVVLLVSAGTAFVGVNRYTSNSIGGVVGDTFGLFSTRFATAMKWLVGRSDLPQRYEEYLQDCRNTRALPPIKGTVDYYPYASRVVMANDLEYHPRPTLQSYTTFNSALEQLNADFLDGPNGPDNVLIEIGAIDRRFPPQEDGLSWIELLTRYELIDASKSLLLFRRSAQPRQYVMQSIQTAEASLGDWIDVPSSSNPIWVKMSLRPTLSGSLVGTLYKPPTVMLNLKLANGLVMSTRLIPGMADAGFLLSPAIIDRMSLAMLMSSDWQQQLAAQNVKQIQIVSEDGSDLSGAYQRSFSMSFSSWTFAHENTDPVPGIAEYLRFKQFVQNAKPMNNVSPPQVVHDDELRYVMLARPGLRLLIDVPPSATRLRLVFGMLRSSYEGPLKSDGVLFHAFGAIPLPQNPQQATLHLLWQRTLDPAAADADRGPQTAEISLPQPPPPKIVLETAPGVSDVADNSYWADVEFR